MPDQKGHRITRRTALISLGGVALAGIIRPAQAAAGIRVSGNRLLKDGVPVLLRGVAVNDPGFERRDHSVADYGRVRTGWFSNVVRIGVHPWTWKNRGNGWYAAVERDVRAARARGLVVILDYHVIGWPDGPYQWPWPGGPADAYDSDFDLAKEFWTHAARTFGADPYILFELWNEAALIYGEDGQPHWRELRPWLAQLVRTIRGNGAGNVCLASGNHWSYDLRGIRTNPLDDPQVAYAWHVYAGKDGNDPRLWAQKLAGVHAVAPVLVTEWGFDPTPGAQHHGTPESFGRPFWDGFVLRRGLHANAWCWSGWALPSLLEDDWVTPTPYGKFVRAKLKAAAAASV